MIVSRRLSPRTFLAAALLCLGLLFLLESLSVSQQRRITNHLLETKDEVRDGYADSAHLSAVLAHQPGFTVIQNLYWQNDTFYIVTDQPWTIPDVDLIVIRPTPTHDGVPTDDKAVRILAVRGPAINAYVREDRQLGVTISPEETMKLTRQAEDLPSPMLFNGDDKFVSHYYHWIGETFLGAWRIWSHYRYRTGTVLPDFKVVAFRHMYDLDDTPPNLNYDDQWEDHAGANRYFVEKWFPGVAIETKALWDRRADSNRLYRIPMVVLANRWAGHRGPSAAWKPWGDVLRMPVHPNYLLDLRDRVLKRYRGVVSLKAVDRPRVKYLTRQDTTRRLTDVSHRSLLNALQRLDDEGLVEFSTLHFVDGDSFQDQLAHISTTDFLVGVHGNGLTHSLWMTPGPCKGVFEMQPKGCSLNDFSPLAIAAGVQHYLVNEDTICTPLKCPDRGCRGDVRGPNRDDIVVDPSVIVDEIRRVIKRHWSNGVEVD